MSQITIDLLDAVKVQFLKQIFEDDFPERGMKAWLTKIEWNEDHCGYDLYFDFSEFEQENEKYFIEVYYSNRHTEKLGLKRKSIRQLKPDIIHQSIMSVSLFPIPAMMNFLRNISRNT